MNEIQLHDPDIDSIARTAKMLALSGYFDGTGNEAQQIAQIGTRILAGQEMGFGPFASNAGIHIIKGNPTAGANLMASAVKAHPKYDYRAKVDNDSVSIEFFEMGESLGVSTFTAADAKQAGTQNMGKYPRNMLFARAMSNGVRWYCPDVFSGNAVYNPDEIDSEYEPQTYSVVEVINGDGEIVQDDGDGTQLPESLDGHTDTAAEYVLTEPPKGEPPKGDPPVFNNPDDAKEWAINVMHAWPNMDEANEAWAEVRDIVKAKNPDATFGSMSATWIGVVTKQAAANAENASA